MTFSIVARCSTTGQLAVGCATSDLAVGARVPHAIADVGAIATQHTTDPRLGSRALMLLQSGCTAQQALDAVLAATDLARARQVAIVGPRGEPATWTGALVDREASADLVDTDCAVIGNMLANADVGPAILEAFQRRPDASLGTRVIDALVAGLDAGGEEFPLRSASLRVVAEQNFPYADLRVDDHDEPIADLLRLWTLYEPRADEYVRRAIDPDRSYALAADEDRAQADERGS